MNTYTNYLKTIQNDEKFVKEINFIKTILSDKAQAILPGEKYAVKRLMNILEHIRTGSDFELNINGYINFRPIDDFIGGEEFLYSPLGKRFIDVCFYFAYVYWPNRMKGK